MIKVDIKTKNGSIVRGEFSGHAMFSDTNDIVCASVSSVVFATLNGIENIIGISFVYEVKDGYLLFIMPDNIEPNKKQRVDDLLNTLYLYLVELEKQYEVNIKVVKTEV